MSIDDNLRDMFKEAIPPADTPPGLADELIARAATTGNSGAGGGTTGGAAGFGLPLIIGLAVAGGVVLGGVLGLFGGGSTPPPTAATVDINAVPAYVCPGEGEVGTLFRGDRVLITGRSGDWVAVRNVRGSNERVFVRADYVDPDADISGLPEENCDDAGTLTVAGAPVETTTTTVPDSTTSTVPADTSSTTTTTTTTTPDTSTTSTTTTVPSTTTSTTSPPTSTTTLPPTTTTTTTTTTTVPPTTTTTTQPPDTTDPAIANANITPGKIWEQDGMVGGFNISCMTPEPRQATISAFVTDNVGVTSVTATWADPLGGESVSMSSSGSTYTGTFGPYAAGTWGPTSDPWTHPVTVTVTALDAAGNATSTTVSVTVTEIGQCFG